MMTETFPCMDIGQMDFDERDMDSKQSVSNCNAGMGKRCRINQNEINSAHRIVNAVYDLVFSV